MNSQGVKKSQEDSSVKEFFNKIYSKSRIHIGEAEKSRPTYDKEGTAEA
jgi:hypothetical protein